LSTNQTAIGSNEYRENGGVSSYTRTRECSKGPPLWEGIPRLTTHSANSGGISKKKKREDEWGDCAEVAGEAGLGIAQRLERGTVSKTPRGTSRQSSRVRGTPNLLSGNLHCWKRKI